MLNRTKNRKTPKTERHSALPKEGTREFDEACAERLNAATNKYAYTAQQEGIILRRNPLKLAPYRDYVFDRISRAEYGFRYLDARGKTRVWFPSSDMLMRGFDPYWVAENPDEPDIGFLITERIEFLPGQPEVTHDADECRVLNCGGRRGGPARARRSRRCSWSTLSISWTAMGKRLSTSLISWRISCSGPTSASATPC